jgi:hypothetical protein
MGSEDSNDKGKQHKGLVMSVDFNELKDKYNNVLNSNIDISRGISGSLPARKRAIDIFKSALSSISSESNDYFDRHLSDAVLNQTAKNKRIFEVTRMLSKNK